MKKQFIAKLLVLALVLGKVMDSNFRRAVSLASSADNKLAAMFGHWITVLLLICTVFVLVNNIPVTRTAIDKMLRKKKEV